jgi:rod shape-determining protein MreD
MKYVFLAVSSVLAIVAQMIAGKNFFLFNFFDLALVLVAYWALYRSRTQALFVGSAVGLLLDAALGWPLGYNGFGKTLAAFVIGAASRRFNLEGGAARFAVIAVASAISSLSVLALFAVLERQASAAFVAAAMTQSLVTGVAGTVMLSIVDAYDRSHSNRVS